MATHLQLWFNQNNSKSYTYKKVDPHIPRDKVNKQEC